MISAKILKQSKLDRTVCTLQKNLWDEDQPHYLVLNRAASLSEDLEEENYSMTGADTMDFAVVSEKVRKPRKRRDYSGVAWRRSARIKIRSISKDV